MPIFFAICEVRTSNFHPWACDSNHGFSMQPHNLRSRPIDAVRSMIVRQPFHAPELSEATGPYLGSCPMIHELLTQDVSSKQAPTVTFFLQACPSLLFSQHNHNANTLCALLAHYSGFASFFIFIGYYMRSFLHMPAHAHRKRSCRSCMSY